MNNVQLIGHLGNDPELRYTQGGTAVVTLSVATNARWNDKDGNKQSRTDWHKIKVYGKSAENHKEYLSKGSHVGVTGELRCDTWTDDDGNNRKAVYVLGRQIDYLSSVTSDELGEPPTDNPEDDRVFTDDDIPF